MTAKEVIGVKRAAWMVVPFFLWVAGASIAAQNDTQPVSTLEEVVVTATRTEASARSVPVSTSVVTGKEIAASGAETVKDALRYVEGLYVQSYGGPGRSTNLRIRGMDSRWVMVMIDGMEVNDPSAIGGAFDFSDLSVDNVNRIEVVRGAESPLYGSDAMAGVVNIITKGGTGRPGAELSGYLGSMDTWQTRLSSWGKVGLFDYSISLSHLETNGISKDDRFWDRNYSFSVGLDASENLRVEGTFRYVNSDLQYDDIDFMTYTTFNDPNQYASRSLLVGTLTATYLPTDWWESQLRFGISDTRRKYTDRFDSESTDHYDSGEGFVSDQLRSVQCYTGRIKKIDWQNTLHLLEREGMKDTLVVGYEYREDEGKSTSVIITDSYSSGAPLGLYKDKTRFSFRRTQLIGYYAQNELNLWDSLTLIAGLRIDDPDDFGGRTTYNLGASYHLKRTDTVFKVRYATGFKAPTLYEIYAPPIPAWWFLGGNRGLVPEENEGYDFGVVQNLFDRRLSLGITYFHQAVDNKIIYYTDPDTWQATYKNISDVVTQGLEFHLTSRPVKDLLLKASYTYVDPQDRENHHRLQNVPINQWNLSAFYTWQDRLNAYLGVRFVGDRIDRYSQKVYRANSYTVADAKVSYRVSPRFEVFLKGNNIFNRQYQEVKGYDAADFSWYLGGKIRF